MFYCDCSACERKGKCDYENCYERLPKEYYKGAKSLCPKISENEKRQKEYRL